MFKTSHNAERQWIDQNVWSREQEEGSRKLWKMLTDVKWRERCECGPIWGVAAAAFSGLDTESSPFFFLDQCGVILSIIHDYDQLIKKPNLCQFQPQVKNKC